MQKPVYLRVSVTDRCNLNCAYCRPVGPVGNGCALADGLSLGDLAGFVRQICATVGIRKLRITGGEPLLVPGLSAWIRELRRALPETELCLTTNGMLLASQAPALKAAGLDRINVSVDSMEPDSFREVTGSGFLPAVLEGIRVARQAGFGRLKINTVLLRSVSGRQLPELVRVSHSAGARIRFIELMPTGPGAERARAEFLPAAEAIALLSREFRYEGPVAEREGTAQLHRFREAGGAVIEVGFIAAVSEPFCGTCDRLRLDCRGRLYACLKDEVGLALVSGVSEQVRAVLRRKAGVPDGMPQPWPRRPMSAIGG